MTSKAPGKTAKHSSLAALLEWRIKETPARDAFYYPDASDNWQTLSWSDVGARVRAVASGLRSLGVDDEQRVAILSGTRIEWVLVDFGILCAGCATTTIYPSNTAEECAYIINDSATVIVFVENDEQANKLQSVRGELAGVKHLVTIDGKSSDDGWIISLADLEAKGKAHAAANPDAYQQVIDRITPQKLATLIYTSGTTGKPKGVELLHDCWLYTGEGMEALGIMRPDDKQFLWLPMSHSFGKVLEVAVVHVGIPTAIDGRIPKIIENCASLQPTFMAAAPRIFEKAYNKIVTGAREAGGLKYKLFRWAVSVGSRVSKLQQQGKQPGGWLAFQHALTDKIVMSKIRARFGGRIRFFISGSAPLSRDMAEFFHAAGMLILEGYGLTESSAASFVNTPGTFAFGTVGHPLPGTEVKIAEADGEILMKSRGIMRGYHNLPDVTAETLQDGWLLTGDIGELDQKGRLKITDRKKDLIKTSGGKYVAPQHLESKLKALCPYLSQVLVHGNARNYCTALVTLDPEGIVKWAAEKGLSSLSGADLAKHADVKAMVQEAVDKLNGGLASYETVKKFAVLPEDFSVESGELTPSLKMKRKVIEQKNQKILDGFYAEAMAQV